MSELHIGTPNEKPSCITKRYTLFHFFIYLKTKRKEFTNMKTESKAKIKRMLSVMARTTIKIGSSAVHIVKDVTRFLLKVVVGIFRRFPNMASAILLMFILNAILMCLSCPGLIIKYVFNPLFLLLFVAGIIKDALRMLVGVVGLKVNGK